MLISEELEVECGMVELMDNESVVSDERRAYDAWSQVNGGPNVVLPDFNSWLAGNRVVRMRVTYPVEGIEPREAGYTLETWADAFIGDHNAPLAAVEGFFMGKHANLWLYSVGPGSGKTGLAVALAKRYASEGHGAARIFRVPRMSPADWRAPGQMPSLVVLDDAHRFPWGAQGGSDMFHAFMDRVYTAGGRIVATSNIKMSALVENIDPDYLAAFDRILDGGGLEVQMMGVSRRG